MDIETFRNIIQAHHCIIMSHKQHPLQREEGSGHAATDDLSPRNSRSTAQLHNKILISTKHVVT